MNSPKTNEALVSAYQIATSAGHAVVTPLHLAAALLSDPRGLLQMTISKSGDGGAANSVIQNAVKEIPAQTPSPDNVFYSDSLVELIRRARSIQSSRGEALMTQAVLILGLLGDSEIQDLLKEGGVSFSKVKDSVEACMNFTWVRTLGKMKSASRLTNFKALKKYGHDLVEDAIDGILDPVIGRYAEIRSVGRILSMMLINNPILIGKPGVGKTAMIKGLAQNIANGEVPDHLANVSLIALDVEGSIAGANFYERLKAVLKEVEEANGKVILFIDNVHLFFGGSMESSELFKPRSRMWCIGATTVEEYDKYDEALGRVFKKVYVEEPSVRDTVSILRGLKEKYERNGWVRIEDRALVAAAQLSAKFITGRHLPAKAIHLVDEAYANAIDKHLVRKLQVQMEQAKASKSLLEVQEEEEEEEEGDELTVTVGPDHIAEAVSYKTGIPVTQLSQVGGDARVRAVKRMKLEEGL